MKIKITEAQLKQLVREEAIRFKRVLELEKKKKELQIQLKELYEGDYAMEAGMNSEVEEGFLDFLRPNPEEKRNKIKALVQQHPHYGKVVSYWAQETGQSEEEVFNQLLDFMNKEASIVDGELKGVGSIVYNPQIKAFVNKTKFSMPYGFTSNNGDM